MKRTLMHTLGKKIADNVSKAIIDWSLSRPLGIETGTTGASGDLTKEADAYAEEIVFKTITDFLEGTRYKVVLIAEETGVVTFGKPYSEEGWFIVLDPIDGSNNLRPWKTPSPFVSTSIALGDLKNLRDRDNFDSIDIGFVKDIFNNRLYQATRGEGASVEGFGRISTSSENEVYKAILGVDLDMQKGTYESVYSVLKDLMNKKRCQRRLGSSILDFMKVACGEYDSFASMGGRLGFYDLAAAKLIAEEAGGIFEILSSQPEYCIIKRIIETNDPGLLKAIKYKAIASGNRTIHERIRGMVGDTH
jgi:myo-inositol-1(or 4)-monophosphatase